MTATSPGPASPRPGDDRLRRDGQRIEALLEELAEMAAAPAYQRVEELVQRVVRLYGAGLERLLEAALDGEGEARDARLGRICADELVSGLLLIHGLHPQPPADRVREALDKVRSQTGRRVELVEIDAAGAARLRIEELDDDGGLIERAVLDAAPELTAVTIEGARDPELVQIDIGRSRRSG